MLLPVLCGGERAAGSGHNVRAGRQSFQLESAVDIGADGFPSAGGSRYGTGYYQSPRQRVAGLRLHYSALNDGGMERARPC